MQLASLDDLFSTQASRDEAQREKVQEILQEQCEFAPASCNRQRAACVAVLGQSLAAAGKTVSSDDFAPEYLRMSQAERERMEADEAHRELMKAGITK